MLGQLTITLIEEIGFVIMGRITVDRKQIECVIAF